MIGLHPPPEPVRLHGNGPGQCTFPSGVRREASVETGPTEDTVFGYGP